MAHTWTPAQTDAINAKGGSIIVSAAAGSGKTAVLVERVMQRICDENCPADLDKLLIVTFTNKATGEMRDRISKAISDKLKSDPKNEYLRHQQASLGQANITTINSFCTSIVREYFYKLDNISSDFRIADDKEIIEYQKSALKITLNKFYSSNDSDFFDLANAFSNNKPLTFRGKDVDLEEFILKIYTFLCSMPFGERWIDNVLQNYNSDIDTSQTIFGKFAIDYLKDTINYLEPLCIDIVNKALSNEIFKNKKGDRPVYDYVSYYLTYITNLKQIVDSPDNWDSVFFAVNSFEQNSRYPSPNGFSKHHDNIEIITKKDIIKDHLSDIKDLFRFNDADCKSQLKQTKAIVSKLFECVKDFAEEFSKIKRKNNVLDFSDGEKFTLSLLAQRCDLNPDGYIKTEFANQISDRFTEIMVDEYQDTNEMQDTIFKILSNDSQKLFVVGDTKQCIYKFRNAMPEVFIGRKDNSVRYNRDVNKFPARIILDKNFRSREGITDSINFIFKNIMSRKASGIEYNAEEELVAGANYPPTTNQTPVDFILIKSNDDKLDEANAIAQKILQMKADKFQVTDKATGELRPIEYGDITILVRSGVDDIGNLYAKTLISNGIQATCKTDESLLDFAEIRTLVNLLKVVSNPMRDVPLIATLMSPIFAFTSDDIAEIRICNLSEKTPLYTSLIVASECNNLGCYKNINKFLDIIADIRNYSVTVNISELVNYICQVLGLNSIFGANSNAETVKRNINLFCEIASKYEQNVKYGLSVFLNYLDRITENGDEKSSKFPVATDTQIVNQNTVKIMNIHQSKGLEFPVCILANCSKKFNTQDLTHKLLINPQVGLAAKLYDKDNFYYYKPFVYNVLTKKIIEGNIAEEIRLLYVALTRAKEKLIITSAHKQSEKSNLSIKLRNLSYATINNRIPPYVVKTASCYSDWLLLCALIHPNASILRTMADSDISVADERVPQWRFEVIDEFTEFDDDSCTENIETPNEVIAGNLADNTVEILKEFTEFEYPLDAIRNLPLKISTSDLSHKDFGDSSTLATPKFLNPTVKTATQKGTAVHKFLQLCDLNNAYNDINAEFERLLTENLITNDELTAIKSKNIGKIFRSKLFGEILNSSLVMREYKFIVSIDASYVDNTLKPPFDKEQVLMRGAVDLAFVNNDGKLVIVDYKTDRVTEIQTLLQRYKMQLELYKIAMEQSTDYVVHKCVLYSIHLDEYIEF